MKNSESWGIRAKGRTGLHPQAVIMYPSDALVAFNGFTPANSGKIVQVRACFQVCRLHWTPTGHDWTLAPDWFAGVSECGDDQRG
jgi:hypothetical protein